MNAWPGKRKRRRATRGALVVVAMLLIGSAMLRMGHDAGRAFGNAAPAVAPTEASADAVACDASPDFAAMLEAFRQRDARLNEREAAVMDRMQALRVADEAIERKLAQLIEAEQQLADTITIADTAAEDDIGRLTRVYETMKPKQAAALFEEMSPEFAAGFLGRMKPEAAAQIMAGLSPGAAHSFSVVLAGRNANAPKE